ncbi:MAG: hypothetical protein ABWY51_04155 [Gaiellaceae bacterium]
MTERDAEAHRTPPRSRPVLHVVHDPLHAADDGGRHAAPAPEHENATEASPGSHLLEALDSAQERIQGLATRIDRVRTDLQLVHTTLAEAQASRTALPATEALVRYGVLALLAGVMGLMLWAGAVDYALRVTSDTPTFIALVSDMAQRPFAEQSPFLAASVATQHATPYVQALAFVWRVLDGSHSPAALGSFLTLVGLPVFAFTLWCVWLYVRRLAGSTAAWVSIPVLLGIFGPPHVIWASDLSLHAALYAGFFPQNVALGTTLLTMLALERRSVASLVLACALASLTMLVHPFTGVLLCVLATADGCRLAARRDRAALRAPIALAAGFALGTLWPAYSLDRAFAETGLRGIVFIGLCIAAPLVALGVGSIETVKDRAGAVSGVLSGIETAGAAYRLAIVGIAGTAAVAIWELALVSSPPDESARLAIYWIDGRWRWPLLLVAGTVGLSGLARLARRGHIVPAAWFSGCFVLGTLGAVGLPLPVWYRFLLLCQVPLALGVATVVAESRRPRTTAIVAATFALALGVKVVTLFGAPPTVSYFGQSLQPAWSLGEHIPDAPGVVATDPATAYLIPAMTGHQVLTVDKGHVSSRAELAHSEEGYRLLRRYYAGGQGWWQAAQEMWRRGVRYVVVAKETTLEPKGLDDFIWQNARLRTPAQERALSNYFYENNRVGTLVYDSPDYVVYRLEREKLFPSGGAPQ